MKTILSLLVLLSSLGRGSALATSQHHKGSLDLASSLKVLGDAVKAGDEAQVDAIVVLLKAEVRRRAPTKASSNVSEEGKDITKPRGSCVFDDHVFKLTEEAKQELSQELQNPVMAGNLSWVQGHDSEFHLSKKLKSKSYLQEAWIFLLRLLGSSRLLPAGTGDRLYHGYENWYYRGGEVLERHWLDSFVKDVVAPKALGPRCMEWGFNYIHLVPQCTIKTNMIYESSVYEGKKPPWWTDDEIHSDVEHLPSVLTKGEDLRMNLIFATQVFEHLVDPLRSAKQLFASLRPGGALVFTVPQQAQYHLVPSDYFRFTKTGAVSILQRSGFCVPEWSVVGGGDFIFDIGRDAGLQVEDFPEIDAGLQFGYNKVSDSAITIHVLAFKPPHKACDQQLPAVS